MTIKHAIPKIEWTSNYYITRSRQEVRSVGVRNEMWLGKLRQAEGALGAPDELGSREVADKMQ